MSEGGLTKIYQRVPVSVEIRQQKQTLYLVFYMRFCAHVTYSYCVSQQTMSVTKAEKNSAHLICSLHSSPKVLSVSKEGNNIQTVD